MESRVDSRTEPPGRIWLPPEVFSQFQAQQLLDQDQTTGQTVAFGGIQGQTAVIVISGPGDSVGAVLRHRVGHPSRSAGTNAQIPGTGVNITELTLVGQT